MKIESLPTKKKTRTKLQESVTTMVDENGVIQATAQYSEVFLPQAEPDYIKVYTNAMLALRNIPVGLGSYILAFANYMTYANDNVSKCQISTDELVRRGVAKQLGVSDSSVKKAIGKLKEAEVFIPIELEEEVLNKKTGKIEIKRKELQGKYFVNPWVVSRGKWEDIRKLRGEFTFTSEDEEPQLKSGVQIIDSEGNRRTIMTAHKKVDKIIDGQMSLFDGALDE